MSLLNPMGLNINGAWPGNYQQQNGNPSVNANIASYAVGSNVLGLSWPINVFVQPADPHPGPAWANAGGAGPTVQ